MKNQNLVHEYEDLENRNCFLDLQLQNGPQRVLPALDSQIVSQPCPHTLQLHHPYFDQQFCNQSGLLHASGEYVLQQQPNVILDTERVGLREHPRKDALQRGLDR